MCVQLNDFRGIRDIIHIIEKCCRKYGFRSEPYFLLHESR